MSQYPIHKSSNKQAVISLGGSLIIPNEIDVEYLKQFYKFIQSQLKKGWRFFIVTGGGAPARCYPAAAREVLDGKLTKEDMDWLGIHATRINAHLLRTMFRQEAQPAIITDPEKDRLTDAKIIVVSGWKPGWSTDFVASKIAQRIGAPYIINLSNVKKVYDDDPKKNPKAKPIDQMSWADYRKIIGDEWTPGLNTPYDPIAAKLAQKEGQTVLIMDGKNLENLKNAFAKGKFIGTVLSK
jgi:uridylate kinase